MGNLCDKSVCKEDDRTGCPLQQSVAQQPPNLVSVFQITSLCCSTVVTAGDRTCLCCSTVVAAGDKMTASHYPTPARYEK